MPRSQLDGLSQASGEEYLAYAVQMQWLVIDGDQVARGRRGPTATGAYKEIFMSESPLSRYAGPIATIAGGCSLWPPLGCSL